MVISQPPGAGGPIVNFCCTSLPSRSCSSSLYISMKDAWNSYCAMREQIIVSQFCWTSERASTAFLGHRALVVDVDVSLHEKVSPQWFHLKTSVFRHTLIEKSNSPSSPYIPTQWPSWTLVPELVVSHRDVHLPLEAIAYQSRDLPLCASCRSPFDRTRIYTRCIRREHSECYGQAIGQTY